MSQLAPALPDDLMTADENEPSGRISATFKEGTGFDACWVVVEAANAVELSNIIQRLRQLGAFKGVRQVAAEFRGSIHLMGMTQAVEGSRETAALDRAAAEIERAMPGTTEVQPAGPPKQTDSQPCSKCGQPAQYREGTGRNGAYKGYACTADRTHFEHVK